MESDMIRKENGYTLVELLVALALTGIVIAAVYKSFTAQQKVYIAQDEVAAMQQDLRAVMDIMVKEIRMAGYDPTGSKAFGFVSLPSAGPTDYGRYTSSDGIAFYADTDPADGLLTASDSENIAFRLNVDQNGNALAGSSRDRVLRKYSTGAVKWQPMAENIEALGFAYAFDNDGDGKLDTSSNGVIWAIDTSSPPDGTLKLNLDTNHDGEVNELDAPAGEALPTPVSLDKIRAVKIWVLERSRHMDKDFVDKKTYVVANQRITPNDNYRRRILSATVKCRNAGLAK